MSTIRKQGDKWQSIVRVQGHLYISKSFTSKSDVSRWAQMTEIKLRIDDAGISKIRFPKFEAVKNNFYF